ncbi:hypothetical protein PJE062_2113 [Pseudovibrio sp. JE062]|nr:hypothetical protein PJE062_2113 [Pseudovibrio sp. JE062]
MPERWFGVDAALMLGGFGAGEVLDCQAGPHSNAAHTERTAKNAKQRKRTQTMIMG